MECGVSSGRAELVLIVGQDADFSIPAQLPPLTAPEPVSRLAVGHPKGVALTPVRTTSRFTACGDEGG
jgi:hypothetical protein